MPTPTQIREQRINKLVETFKNRNISTIDDIYKTALNLFPTTRKETVKEYAETALRILQTKKRGE